MALGLPRAFLAVCRLLAASGSTLEHACSKSVTLCWRHCLHRGLRGHAEVTARRRGLQPQALLGHEIMSPAEQTALELCSEALEGHCWRWHFRWDPSQRIPVGNCVHHLSQMAGLVPRAS